MRFVGIDRENEVGWTVLLSSPLPEAVQHCPDHSRGWQACANAAVRCIQPPTGHGTA